MPNCPTHDELKRLLDDELATSARGPIAAHVDHCSICQGKLDSLTTNLSSSRRYEADIAHAQDSTITALVKRLSETPWVVPEPASIDGDQICFPDAPSEGAPLGSLGSYRIQERIAAGANGILYRAIDSELGRTVGIKVLRETVAASAIARTRLLREARAAATIKSDYVVSVFQVGSYPHFPPFLVLEFVEGLSLREKLDAEGALPPKLAAVLVREAALGLAAAHNKGIVHRDVKPSNILLENATGRARLTDFGLARSDQEGHRLTFDGAIAGTPAYMSVEQITDPSAVDARTDVYSLGVVLYELLTGNVPFRGVLRMTVSQILHDEPIAPRRLDDTIPRDMETICLKAMAKDREQRYGSAIEFAADLDAFTHGKPIAARPISSARRAFSWCRRNQVVTGLTAAIAGLLIVLTLVSVGAVLRLARANETSRQNGVKYAQQRDAALATLGKLIFDIQDKFDSDEIDLDDLQTNVLQVALDGLQQVDPASQLGAVSGLQLATAYRRLGEILARTEGTKQADEYLQHALEILEATAKEDTLRPEVLRQLAETELSRSDYFAFDRESSAAKDAAKAVEWSRKLQAIDPSGESTQRLLRDSLIAFGQCAQANRDSLSAKSAFEEALERMASESKLSQRDPAQRTPQLEALLGLAQALQMLGMHDAATKTWQTLLAEKTSFQEAFPSNVASHRYQLAALDGLHAAALSLNDSNSAKEYAHLANVLAEELHKNSSAGPLYLDEIVSMYEEIAQDWERMGNHACSDKNDQRRVDFLKYRIEQAPLDSHARHNLGLALLDQANSQNAQDDLLASLDRAIEAIEILEPLALSADRDPEVVESYLEALKDAEELALDAGREDDAAGFKKKLDTNIANENKARD